MNAVTLSSKFQIAIPARIRREMGLQSGQRFTVIAKGDAIALVPIKPVRSARGLLRDIDTEVHRDADRPL